MSVDPTWPTKRYPAGRATYPGDVRSIVGELKGPSTHGRYVIASGASYDAETDTTRVDFVHATDGDMRALIAAVSDVR